MRWPEMFFRPKSQLPNQASLEMVRPKVPGKVFESSITPTEVKKPEPTLETAVIELPKVPVLFQQDKLDPIPPPTVPLPVPIKTTLGSYSEIPAAIEQVLPTTTPAVQPAKTSGHPSVGESPRRRVKLTDVAKVLPAKRKPVQKPYPAPTRVILKRRGMGDFSLVNGERIVGGLVSQDEREVVLQNPALGRVTILRGEMAKELRNLVLINGDHLVGEVIAESPEQVYLRHSSLGTLIIHRSQIGSHIGQARLPDGSRIVGEVLGERDGYTLLKSATMGVLSVQNDRVSVLG